MRKGWLRRPSPALVVSCLALAVALGGTSYATVLQVPRASVGTPQLRNAAVTTPKLANNAVTSAKVRNGSLLRADFRRGQLPAGPPGPPGPAGPAGPPGLSGVERIENTIAASSVATKSTSLTCPSGKRLIGGGARVLPLNIGGVALTQSFPDNDNVYRAAAREVVATPGQWSLTAYAICAAAS
jgi:hypothetical protein